MIEMNIPGFRSFEVFPTNTGATALGATRVGGRYYFVHMTFDCREDGSLREKKFSRRIETFCGKAVRSKVNTQLEDLAEIASEAVLARLLFSEPSRATTAGPSAHSRLPFFDHS